MRDYQEVILKFVKIIERHPEVYDSTLETYRTRHVENAWERIADSVRTELNDECTVEEIKTKWKGIRSSFNRFKNKLNNTTSEGVARKKYYLYDSLRFLEPFIRPKGIALNAKDLNSEDCSNYTNSDDDEKNPEDLDSEKETWKITVKSEISDEGNDSTLNTNEALNIDMRDTICTKMINQDTGTKESGTSDRNRPKKRKCEDSAQIDSTDSEDLQFFKSILPDIKDFSTKDKRKLKIGILKLIDEIDNNRKHVRPFHLCNCH